ncbi:ClpP/crotonase [Meira miltonrushii]|uniref:3-hydroxyisobutyryl-CoA hydrolase n=1 Tax=Meira miltonrushii TaxID=1280837 RepID=A0A316VFD9_9BASI|nr:ClpP/crotonase [Meira miltonrushii]PWN36347.1 ClpP/crotonase [Meira miltonrushii]
MSASASSASVGSGPNPTTSSNRTGGGDDGSEAKVITSNNGSTSTILLNRPKALNAIDTEMVQLISEGIDQAPTQNRIILRGKGRALCSGGDVLAVVNAANSQDAATRQQALTFFKNEFELDYKIAMLDKQSIPRVLISIMDGITMGGGVGLSIKAPIRVATEKTMFAMPETGIGYWPDVGVTRDLARLDGKIGVYLGMTGARISGEEAYLTGLATHFLKSNVIDDALHRLAALPPNASAESVAETLEEFASDPIESSSQKSADEALPKSPFFGLRRVALDYVFGLNNVEAILQALKDIAEQSKDSVTAKALAKINVPLDAFGLGEWAQTTLKTLHTKSPRSLKVTFRAVKEARQNDIPAAFEKDMRLATAFCDLGVGRDFYEGVTFTLTKDPATGKRREGIANWDAKTVEEVDDDKVEKVFFGSLEDAKYAGLTMDIPKLEGLPSGSIKKKVSVQGVGPLHWEKGHNRLALPSEAECEALREGSHPAAGDYQLEGDEMIKILRRSKDKPSLEFKVNEWLKRRQA